MPNFQDNNDVTAWLAANGGIEGLRRAVELGQFANRNKTEALAWLNAHDRADAAAVAQSQMALLEREVKAAESSAAASRTSSRVAICSAAIAVVAAIVSVVQYLPQR